MLEGSDHELVVDLLVPPQHWLEEEKMMGVNIDVGEEFGVDGELEVHDGDQGQILSLEDVDAKVSHQVIEDFLAVLGE